MASLLLARDSTLTSAAIYDILKKSAVTELQSGTIIPPDTLYGWGRVDAYRAMLSIVRGDVDNNGINNLADLTYLIAYVYEGGPEPLLDSRTGNCNCDSGGLIDLADITKLIDNVFVSKNPLNPCYVY